MTVQLSQKHKKITAVSDKDFYKFSMKQVKETLSPDYLKFLKESGYVTKLRKASGLMIAKRILKTDDEIRKLINKNNIEAYIEDNKNYIVYINQTSGRRLVNLLGYQLPTAGIMYKLFIPYLKQSAKLGNKETKATLNEMTNEQTGKAEWLEDLILDNNKVKIGNKKRRISLSQRDGRYDISALNEFGHPDPVGEFGNPYQVENYGEFYYFFIRKKELAAIRGRKAGGLSLHEGPFAYGEDLGVRFAKFF